MKEEYNFKIGDYIHLNENLNIYTWYTDEVFEIVEIINGVLIVDRDLPYNNVDKNSRRIHPSKAVLDMRMIRSKKLKSMLYD